MLTSREMLDAIDAFLVSPDVEDSEKTKLWDVLTGLRGPESTKGDAAAKALKTSITGVIRANALPRNAFRRLDARTNRAIVTLSRSADFANCPKGHFRYHAFRACQALGIVVKNHQA